MDAFGGGVPPSWIGELFFNFHVVGVVLGCLSFGWISARVFLLLGDGGSGALLRVFYVYYLLFFTFNLGKTEFRTAVIRLAGFLTALVVARVITRWTQKGRGRTLGTAVVQ